MFSSDSSWNSNCCDVFIFDHLNVPSGTLPCSFRISCVLVKYIDFRRMELLHWTFQKRLAERIVHYHHFRCVHDVVSSPEQFLYFPQSPLLSGCLVRIVVYNVSYLNGSSWFSSLEFLVFTFPSQIFFLPSISEVGEETLQVSFSPGQCVHRCSDNRKLV